MFKYSKKKFFLVKVFFAFILMCRSFNGSVDEVREQILVLEKEMAITERISFNLYLIKTFIQEVTLTAYEVDKLSDIKVNNILVNLQKIADQIEQNFDLVESLAILSNKDEGKVSLNDTEVKMLYNSVFTLFIDFFMLMKLPVDNIKSVRDKDNEFSMESNTRQLVMLILALQDEKSL